MDSNDWKRFHQLLQIRARELSPDYPGIETEEDPFTLLAAITSELAGTTLTNETLHKIIEAMRDKLGMSVMDVVDFAKTILTRE